METDSGTGSDEKKPLFRDLNADDDVPEVTEIESVCMNCYENGYTRLLLTKIPYFREVIVSSFNCDHCGFQNNELQPGGRIQELGCHFAVNIKNAKDLNRQVVISPSATVRIPSLDFEVPPNKGSLTTVEGVIDRAVEGLQQDQPIRKATDPETAEKIDEFIKKLEILKDLSVTGHFVLELDDPSGNSFIENPFAPKPDSELQIRRYPRTLEQNKAVGLLPDDATENLEEPSMNDAEAPVSKDEILSFPNNCSSCNSPCETRMKMVDIPFFKEVVIMATACDACGYRDNEVKGGAGVEPKGKKITLHLTDVSDLSRDVLKSETSGLQIPEIQLDVTCGTLGGRFTTVEGLLTNVKEQLQGDNRFVLGDSSQEESKNEMNAFLSQLDEIISGKRLDVHLVLDDPAGNSYLQNVYAPDDDPEMKIEIYERNFEQNEELGLNDMKTENYANDS